MNYRVYKTVICPYCGGIFKRSSFRRRIKRITCPYCHKYIYLEYLSGSSFSYDKNGHIQIKL